MTNTEVLQDVLDRLKLTHKEVISDLEDLSQRIDRVIQGSNEILEVCES